MEEAAEALRNLTEGWWTSEDTVLAVARILDDFGSFESPGDVVSYFMRPWRWETEILRIIEDVGRPAPVSLS